MLAIGIFHQCIVSLIQHIRAVAIGTILLQIRMLVHVCIHSNDAVFCVGCIERIQQFFEIAFFLCCIVFQYPKGHISFQFPGKLHLRLGFASLQTDTAKDRQQDRQDQYMSNECEYISFHIIPTFLWCGYRYHHRLGAEYCPGSGRTHFLPHKL